MRTVLQMESHLKRCIILFLACCAACDGVGPQPSYDGMVRVFETIEYATGGQAGSAKAGDCNRLCPQLARCYGTECGHDFGEGQIVSAQAVCTAACQKSTYEATEELDRLVTMGCYNVTSLNGFCDYYEPLPPHIATADAGTDDCEAMCTSARTCFIAACSNLTSNDVSELFAQCIQSCSGSQVTPDYAGLVQNNCAALIQHPEKCPTAVVEVEMECNQGLYCAMKACLETCSDPLCQASCQSYCAIGCGNCRNATCY